METFYCQNCLAPNRLTDELCLQCGTRLMLVVEPASARFDYSDSQGFHDEHLLERISTLETRLTRSTEQLENCLHFLLRQARHAYFDRALIETLIETLSDKGLVEAEQIDEVWRERCRRAELEQDESQRRDTVRAEIIADYKGEMQNAFRTIVDSGMDDLSEGNVARGIRSLEEASASAKCNAPLNSFLGEHYFRMGKMAWARNYLERALLTSPNDDRVCLLLGLACGDEGQVDRARQLLCDVLGRGKSSFAAHYALGRLLVVEELWADALLEFKQALAVRPSPETHYVVGCVYFRLNRNRMAARHLRKAVAMNGAYSAALHMLGLVFLRSGDETRARDAFSAAREAGQDESRYRSRPRGGLQAGDIPSLPPLFRAARLARKRLVTSGDKRLAEAMVEDALKMGLRRTAITK